MGDTLRVHVMPADEHGCGAFRMKWPGEELARQGHDVTVVPPKDRDVRLRIEDETVREVVEPPEGWPDVMVFQRLTHPWMAQAVPLLRQQGVAVVIDVDDDLAHIHPRNPAFEALHPRNARNFDPRTNHRPHNWLNLAVACREATLVTVSTDALLAAYAAHGRGRVLHNVLPSYYDQAEHTDSDVIGWPAALASHPDDPSACGGAIARLVNDDGAVFRVIGPSTGTGVAFGLRADAPGVTDDVTPAQWPQRVAELGVGIVPLADTRFNAAKSWLKGLEMSALGVPWVGSPRAEYRRLNALGAGVLADRPRTWYRELARLRTSESARTELAAKSREAVRALRFEHQAYRWMEAWTDAVAIQRGQRQTVAA